MFLVIITRWGVVDIVVSKFLKDLQYVLTRPLEKNMDLNQRNHPDFLRAK